MMPVQSRSALENPAGEQIVRVADAKEAAGRKVVGDGDDQFLRGVWLPDKITLEVRQHSLSGLNLPQKLLEFARVCIFKEAHENHAPAG
jgi:hypothetical protein